ncbi:hypothetical protein BN1080_02109 [Planococcus massiliensis]|uniref:Uncharacterized protein n=1 Tax=Planococcus massiliensis TaxID=1499687 RepID=A0A098EMX1_9BACL|nr:hypothetical protein [Planococcus massiliensis]CEG23165.1 hypothetical protein BN1080_02109 [Planococcus massiliensis]
MLNEQNVIEVMTLGAIASGFIGAVVGAYVLDRANEKNSGREVHRQFNTNYARKMAALATSSGTIRKGWN